MSLARLLDAIRDRVAEVVQTWASGARGGWCRSQRRRLLSSSDAAVVWVRGPTLPWAEWGARRGYFAIEHLRALPGPAA